MGIGKGKSDKIDLDGLIGSVNNENKATQEASSLAEKVAELEQATKALNTAIDRANSIIIGFNKSVNELQSRKIGAQVHPQTLKSLNDICTNFVVEVGKQLMAHRDKQLELQKEHEERIARMLESNEGIWLSNRWVIFTVIVLGIFAWQLFYGLSVNNAAIYNILPIRPIMRMYRLRYQRDGRGQHYQNFVLSQ